MQSFKHSIFLQLLEEMRLYISIGLEIDPQNALIPRKGVDEGFQMWPIEFEVNIDDLEVLVEEEVVNVGLF